VVLVRVKKRVNKQRNKSLVSDFQSEREKALGPCCSSLILINSGSACGRTTELNFGICFSGNRFITPA